MMERKLYALLTFRFMLIVLYHKTYTHWLRLNDEIRPKMYKIQFIFFLLQNEHNEKTVSDWT